MQRYKLIIAYDGTDYAGWQTQPSGRTIQGELEEAFFRFTGRRAKVHGSGRTDQGVHAAGQVAHVDLIPGKECEEIGKALNALLPADVRVLKVSMVSPDFHARRSALGKEYRYFIREGEVIPPFIRRYRCHIRTRLDVEAMRRAASALTGKHDFSAFTANPRREVGSMVRDLRLLTVRRTGREVIIIAEGDGFLYKMVRSLVGFLIRVGEGSLHFSDAETILCSETRTARVPTALPSGLFLWRVSYRNKHHGRNGKRMKRGTAC